MSIEESVKNIGTMDFISNYMKRVVLDFHSISKYLNFSKNTYESQPLPHDFTEDAIHFF